MYALGLLAAVVLYGCAMDKSESKAMMEPHADSISTESVEKVSEESSHDNIQDTLGKEQMLAYMTIGKQKLKDYADYMSIALDLKYREELRIQAEQQAWSLFIEHAREKGEEQWIWPDSLRSQFEGRNVKVIIDSIEVSGLPEKELDNVYRGQLTFRQTITGSHREKKHPFITIVNRYSTGVLIMRKEKKFGDETQETWEVMLDAFGEKK
jgi:hypothetical protein